MTRPLGGIFKAFLRGHDSVNVPATAVMVEAPTEVKKVRMSIYCAGTTSTTKSNDEKQFKSEAEREKEWGLVDFVVSGRTIERFYGALEKTTAFGEKFIYLSIYSHVTRATLFLDNGEPAYPRSRYEAFSKKHVATESSYLTRDGVKPEDVSVEDFFDGFIKVLQNKLLSNALVVFAGCNAGNTDDNEDNNIALYFTKQTGIASIGANGTTFPQDGIRTVSNHYHDNNLITGEYLLFYKDAYAYVQQHPLGGKLNKETIESAIKFINDLQHRKNSVITR